MGESKEKYIVDEKGNKTAVVLSIKEFEGLKEDLHDLAVVAERRKEPTVKMVDLKKRLKKNGLL